MWSNSMGDLDRVLDAVEDDDGVFRVPTPPDITDEIHQMFREQMLKSIDEMTKNAFSGKGFEFNWRTTYGQPKDKKPIYFHATGS